jgi:hypothetical protein
MAAILISEWVRSGELQLYFLSKQILMTAILIFNMVRSGDLQLFYLS